MDKKVHEAFYGKNNKYFVHVPKVSTRPLLGWEGHGDEASNELTYSNCLKQDVAQRRVDKISFLIGLGVIIHTIVYTRSKVSLYTTSCGV